MLETALFVAAGYLAGSMPFGYWLPRLLKGVGSIVVLGDMMDKFAVELKERAEEPVAQPHGASDDRFEDRPHIGRRAADDAQDLGSRRLAPLRLG